jgi:hypothetical protein
LFSRQGSRVNALHRNIHHEVHPMKSITTAFIVLGGFAFASTPFLVQAAQIAPNPNRVYSRL